MNAYSSATIALAVSGGLHLLAAPLTGFALQGNILIPIAALYALLAWRLSKRDRAIAYLVFICMLVGFNGALVALGDGVVPDWIYGAIMGADLVCAIALFAVLWNTAQRPKTTPS